MEILKEGNKKPETHKHTCYKCKTKFKYERKDVQYDFRDGNYVNCPKCNAFIASKF